MATNFCEEFLGSVLNCSDYRVCERLNTIVMNGDEVYSKCKDMSDISFEGVLKAVQSSALNYLTTFYRMACDAFDNGLYGIYKDDEIGLLKECLDFISPHDDLHIEVDSDGVYLELDYWDLYANVVDELAGNDRYNFKDFLGEFTANVYGGKHYPEKFDVLL